MNRWKGGNGQSVESADRGGNGKGMNAIIVLNYNDYQTTVEFIRNFRDYSVLDKIIIVDNCSTDQSFEILSSFSSDKIDVIRTEKNGGYASGNAAGVEYALSHYAADHLIISNPDIYISEQCLREMIRVLDEHKEAGIVSCRVVTPKDCRQLPSAWKIPCYGDCLREFLPSGYSRTQYSESYYSASDVAAVEVIPGSLFAMKAEVYQRIGGFDTNTFLYYEENILAYQLRSLGYTNYLLTGLSYMHYVSKSINKNQKSLRKRLKLLEQSREYYCDTYLKINIWQKFLMRILYLANSIAVPVYVYEKQRKTNR